MPTPMRTRHLPLIGIVLAVCLLGVATTFYPGGTADSPSSVGYNWAQNFISTLFAPTAHNGAPNQARLVAIPAMFLLCLSLGALFWSIGRHSGSRAHRKVIEIAGVGAMVYAFLVVTPMHNLMINIALPLALVTLLTILHLLYTGRRWRLLSSGVVCVALLLLTAAMYYGGWLHAALPLTQKLSLVPTLGWLLALHYALLKEGAEAVVVPSKAVEATPPVATGKGC